MDPHSCTTLGGVGMPGDEARIRSRFGVLPVRLLRVVRLAAGRSAVERRLLVRAGLALTAARLAQWLVPFGLARRVAGRPPRAGAPGAPSVEQIEGAVLLASACVPRANCLTRALAAQVLLGRAGHASRLCLGVRPTERFEAHAWLECEGRALLGGPGDAVELRPPGGSASVSP